MYALDWGQVDAEVMHALYAREVGRWRDSLSWDTTATWPIVERGRELGTVGGAVAFDGNGEPAGWCFALLRPELLQVGGFVARSESATAALIDLLASSPAGRRARRWTWFGWFDAEGLAGRLASHRGVVVRYVYLGRSLAAGEVPAAVSRADDAVPRPVRAWQPCDTVRLPGLLASAYPPCEEGRPFAASGTIDEWREYAAQIVDGGCGVFDPGLSVVAGGEGIAGTLDGAAVLTRIAPSTAHLAQLAVRAGTRGLGRALLAQALARATARGYTELTLLVHEQNARARRLYQEAGFEERATFLSAAQDVGSAVDV